ncbi:MAG: hypothetical protein KDD58_03930 [Bdellovibrionales bacterium]|nr:hypothetical protein [Bdellovibrionales bacterium]
MQVQELKEFSELEHDTWSTLFNNLKDNRAHQADPIFTEGIEILGLSGDRIPDLNEINKKLSKLTGWQAVPVKGFEEVDSFFKGLSEKQFPIGNFIRDNQDLSYTPAPDIFHDLYGHIPFFANKDYADFNQRFGEVALKYIDSPEKLKKFDRLYWFGLEFPLIDYPEGRRIFGGGLLSSFGESNYALSDKPKVLSFDVEKIANQDFRIDVYQEILFCLSSKEQLYNCLPDFEATI